MGLDEIAKLYLRLPIVIKEEQQIKDLHPDILAVHLPRQKSRRWCIVDFADAETLGEASKYLKTVKINDKNLKIGPHRKPEVAKAGKKKRQTTIEQSEKSLLQLIGK